MADIKRSSLSSALCYKDPKAALEWLQEAFGFEPYMVISDQDGNIAHSEMTWGECIVMIGTEWTEHHKSPASIGGANTQSVHVHMTEDIDAHCARARKAGAEIVMEPETQFYGDRSYRARDLEGHFWTFSQTVKEMSPEEWDADSGFKTKMYK